MLDLDFGASSVIGDRAFHRDPRVVSLLAKSLMHGLCMSGMANCGKHFPGHGSVAADSHTAVPVDKRSLKAILADDAAPYGWLTTTLSSVMPAHVIYPKVDARPAGFSSKWLNDILRGQLGFGGAIFSDDLSMAGARLLDGEPVSYTQAAVAALNAGCDLVLLCNQSLASSEGAGGVGGTHGTTARSAFFIVHPHLAQSPHGRQMGKTIGLEALHTAAFVVNTDQQVTPHFFDVAAQLGQLGAALPVAGKQDQPPHQRVLQALAVNAGQAQTCNVDDERRMLGHRKTFGKK